MSFKDLHFVHDPLVIGVNLRNHHVCFCLTSSLNDLLSIFSSSLNFDNLDEELDVSNTLPSSPIPLSSSSRTPVVDDVNVSESNTSFQSTLS